MIHGLVHIPPGRSGRRCQLMIDSGNEEHAEAPTNQFTDSSFQDCPDTSRSTGGYITFMQGAAVQAVRTTPTIVSQSTCEAEYCMASLCVMSGSYIKKVLNETLGYHSDRPLTIPVGTDSQSAMDTANSQRETNRTPYIVRHCVGNRTVKLFKVQRHQQPCQLSYQSTASHST
jgi:hypothetical protein